MQININNCRIELVRSDITEQEVATIQYESTDVYRSMNSFMLHRQSVLNELFADEGRP